MPTPPHIGSANTRVAEMRDSPEPADDGSDGVRPASSVGEHVVDVVEFSAASLGEGSRAVDDKSRGAESERVSPEHDADDRLLPAPAGGPAPQRMSRTVEALEEFAAASLAYLPRLTHTSLFGVLGGLTMSGFGLVPALVGAGIGARLGSCLNDTIHPHLPQDNRSRLTYAAGSMAFELTTIFALHAAVSSTPDMRPGEQAAFGGTLTALLAGGLRAYATIVRDEV